MSGSAAGLPRPPTGEERAASHERTLAYMRWVAGLNAGDNPRGDFIEDTRDLLSACDKGVLTAQDLAVRLYQACPEAQVEDRKLQRTYRRATGLEAS